MKRFAQGYPDISEISAQLVRQLPWGHTWLDVYHAIKLDPDFMEERDDFPAQERENF